MQMSDFPRGFPNQFLRKFLRESIGESERNSSDSLLANSNVLFGELPEEVLSVSVGKFLVILSDSVSIRFLLRGLP